MLHLWTHTCNRFVQFGRSITHAFVLLFRLSVLQDLVLCPVFTFSRLPPRLYHEPGRSTAYYDIEFSIPTNAAVQYSTTIDPQSTIKKRQKLLHLFHSVFPTRGYCGPLGQPVLSSGRPCVRAFFVCSLLVVLLSSQPCDAFNLAEAVPLRQQSKLQQQQKSSAAFASHDTLRLSGIRPPPPKVLMPPLDLGFKRQTDSDTRRTKKTRNQIDYQSDAASKDRWSSPVEEQNIGSAAASARFDSQARKPYYKSGKNNYASYDPHYEQKYPDSSVYANERGSYRNTWNPYDYPVQNVQPPYRAAQNDRNYPEQQNVAYNNPMPNSGRYGEISQEMNPYQQPYIHWEPAGYGNVNPAPQPQTQPPLSPYPYARYEMGPGGTAEQQYGRWDASQSAAAYYQQPPPLWSPYATHSKWYVQPMIAQPVLQVGQSIPMNQLEQQSRNLYRTAVVGHPSNYREISHEEMSQRVREYEERQQTAENGELRLPPLTNNRQDVPRRQASERSPDSQLHDNRLFLSGNNAHDQAIKNFVNVASEWSEIGIDALFDEIDLNGDGAIRLEELRKFLRLHEAHIHR